MDFDEYQRRAAETAIYPSFGHRIIYPSLGLASEAGEVAGKIKKEIRDGDGAFAGYIIDEIGDELGDVLWYLARIASELGLSLGDIAERNAHKLRDRADRGVLGGQGDKR